MWAHLLCRLSNWHIYLIGLQHSRLTKSDEILQLNLAKNYQIIFSINIFPYHYFIYFNTIPTGTAQMTVFDFYMRFHIKRN